MNTHKGIVEAVHNYLKEVEGEFTEERCKHQPESALFQLGKCPLKPQTGLACVNCEHYVPNRPATIRDLIGGKDGE